MERVSISEAARLLGVHPARVAHWIGSGRLTLAPESTATNSRRELDRAAVLALQRELDITLRPSAVVETDLPEEPTAESLSRARAVESYTAGLAATAIAPAIGRLVETIDRLIVENGDLREKNGRLAAELKMAQQTAGQALESEPARPENAATVGLTDSEWSSLGERLDKLSRPATLPETGPVASTEADKAAPTPAPIPNSQAQPGPVRRHVPARGRSNPLGRLAGWLARRLGEG